MSLNLVREIIKENRVASRESVQIIIENDIIVPDTKPDIGRILFADGDAYIPNITVDDGNISMDGVIRYKILYVEDNPGQNIIALNINTDFEHSMDVPDVGKGMEGRVKCDVEHVDCQIVNGRKVNVKSILRVKSNITEENEYYFINDIEDNEDIQILRNSVSINKFIGTSQDICTVKESFEVPSGNPSIREILRNDIKITDIECKITDNKIILKGDANIQTLYAGDDKEESIRFMEHEIPFTHVLDLPGINEESDIHSDYDIQNYSFEPLEDEDGEFRFMNGEIQIKIWILGSAKEDIDVIADAYGLRMDLSLEKTKVSMEEFVVGNRSQAVLKETLTAENDYPEIIEIFNVFSRPVLSEYEVGENRICIEGIVNNHILYYSNSPEQPIFCWNQDIPFKQTVEVQGVKPGMACEVNLEIEHSNYNMLSHREVEIRLVIGIASRFYDTVEVSFIEKVLENPTGEGRVRQLRPSITLYFVQEEDSLWNIAKKYRTTIDDIIRENKIDDLDSIGSGMQVLISRK
ncbi:MAG TPA: DUF3794 domain-containing protein [Clostridiales bacterium]|nr:DUF3794 domain-containing protein [Clostridiales bacterium]